MAKTSDTPSETLREWARDDRAEIWLSDQAQRDLERAGARPS